MSASALHYESATALVRLLRAREISAVEVMKTFLARIEELNPKLNSIVSLLPESEALRLAEAADRTLASGAPVGILHGLPTAVKDLNAVAGFPTRFGSRGHLADPVAEKDAAFVARLRAAGALIIGKTNTPEYGVGTLTFNDVFGVTRNPWDLSRHAGGSSGAGAAIAAGLLPIADGSDSGGSIRYPASFCNIVGLRTTPGRVPFEAAGDGWAPHVVVGPMARSSEDAGLLLAAMAGAAGTDPIGIAEDPARFLTLDTVDLSGVRIAWSKDADGLPVSDEMRHAYAGARTRLKALGCTIDDVELDLSTADRAWEAVEMFGFFTEPRSWCTPGRSCSGPIMSATSARAQRPPWPSWPSACASAPRSSSAPRRCFRTMTCSSRRRRPSLPRPPGWNGWRRSTAPCSTAISCGSAWPAASP